MVKTKFTSQLIASFILISCCGTTLFAQPEFDDPFDSFSFRYNNYANQLDEEDSNKTPDQLLQEGMRLQIEGKFIEARTKLLGALKKDPKLLVAHILLADYYFRQVGHFRLALRYAKKALELLFETYGQPPYISERVKDLHKTILSLLSGIRLDLDEYDKALSILDEYKQYNYNDPFYASSRAWILFKMGRNEEALQVARIGLLSSGNKGALLNIIGILLSTTNQKKESLQIFQEALRNERQMGTLGDTSTPLNNAGEVYREIFDEINARRNWEQAVLTPNFCEHILLSLNLTTLNIEELRFKDAKNNLLNFKKCMAQYPLKNEEEYRSLLKLALGRIALHTGDIENAVKHLEDATNEKQFFGRIGTNQDDMQVAALESYSQALLAYNNHLKYRLYKSTKDYLISLYKRASNSLKAKWLMRRAKQLLMEHINDFEDFYFRHTDSMLEYPTLGSLTADIPTNLLRKKINAIKKDDERELSPIYYDTYLAENLISHGKKKSANTLLNNALAQTRIPFDSALKVEILKLKLQILDSTSAEYIKFSQMLLELSASELLNAGLRLPIKLINATDVFRTNIEKSIFFPTNNDLASCQIQYNLINSKHNLFFSCNGSSIQSVSVSNEDLKEAINDLTLAVFKREI